MTASHRAAPWFIGAWSLAILAGVVFLKVDHPETYSPFVRRLIRVEAVHIVAHTFLYGTLAYAATRWTRRWWVPLAIVCAVGFVQEAAQTVLFGRPMGPPEAFDLGVDATAASLVLLGSWWLRRRGAERDQVRP